MEFARLAQDFVDATSQLVGKRTINIMDQQGIIIASTERERVGVFHQGAAEVISTGRSVLIHKEELYRYPGAKEGYNMPIILDKEVVGVVGIFGDEEVVKDIANLLAVYVAQFFEQQAFMEQQKMESEVRTQILRFLMLGNENQMEAIRQLCQVVAVSVTYPVKVYYFALQKREEALKNINHFSRLEQDLLWQGILDKKRDVYGVQDNHFIVIHGAREDEEDETGQIKYANKLKKFINQNLDFRLAVSGFCSSLFDVPRGIREARTLSEIQVKDVCDISSNDCRVQYLLYNCLSHGGKYYIEQMYDRLCQAYDLESAKILLTTALVYYREGGSVTKASEKLHLHKNTLLYRMNRLFTLLGIYEEQSFVKELYVRLILEQYQMKLPEKNKL